MDKRKVRCEKVDYNTKEMEAMELFLKGEKVKAHKLQREFLDEIMSTGEDLCSCSATDCPYHGKCLECVMIHRGHGEHLPECFKLMVNKRIAILSGLTEDSFKR